MPIKCCFQCPDRHVTCHATCTKYKEEKAAHEKLMAKIHEQKELESATFHMVSVEHAGHRRKY